MAKYRKRPVVIEAVQWTGENFEELWRLLESKEGRAVYEESDMSIFLETLEGTMKAQVGDYIIKGVQGEFYPCKPDIFEATYEKVEGVGDFIGDKKPITQHCPTCEQLLAEVKRLQAELAEERRYWK